MADVAFACEQLTAIRGEIAPLLVEHYQEIAHYPDIALDPDWEAYAAGEATGMLRTYTVRHEGLLCGYAVFFVRTNPHYRRSVQASQDVLFLIPELRRSTIGRRFIVWCEERLRETGAQVAYHHAKVAHPALGAVLTRLGYEVVDHIYAKRLDR